MAYEFATASSRILYRSLAPPSTITAMAWVKFDNSSADTNPNWLSHSIGRVQCGRRNTRLDHFFTRQHSIVEPHWRCAAGQGIDYFNWHFVAWRYDGASTANDPTCWLGDINNAPVAKTVTEITAPDGTLLSASGNISIGNLADTAWDRRWGGGGVAYVSYHNAVLSDAAVEEAWEFGYPSGEFASALLWAPLIDNTDDISPNADTGTITDSNRFAGPLLPSQVAGNFGRFQYPSYPLAKGV